jgi:hypothetical protein
MLGSGGCPKSLLFVVSLPQAASKHAIAKTIKAAALRRVRVEADRKKSDMRDMGGLRKPERSMARTPELSTHA